jgi:ribosomal protein S5
MPQDSYENVGSNAGLLAVGVGVASGALRASRQAAPRANRQAIASKARDRRKSIDHPVAHASGQSW